MAKGTMNKLSEVIADAERVRSTVSASAAFGSLSSEQINWKPSSSEWSIAQCLEHLLLLNKPYIPQIERILAGKRQASLWERAPLLPAFFGRLVLAAVQPASKQKVKARPAFVPVSSDIDIGILHRFATHQGDLIRLMKATADLPVEKIIITSVVSPVVTYSLLDAYRILVAHERRHLQQAERVMHMQGFPRR
jgi:DinB superfamily